MHLANHRPSATVLQRFLYKLVLFAVGSPFPGVRNNRHVPVYGGDVREVLGECRSPHKNGQTTGGEAGSMPILAAAKRPRAPICPRYLRLDGSPSMKRTVSS